MTIEHLAGKKIKKINIIDVNGVINVELMDGSSINLYTMNFVEEQIKDVVKTNPATTYRLNHPEYEVEEKFEWRTWSQKIPFLNFSNNLLVRVIPPFAGAVARFIVAHKDTPDQTVSVYLDCYNKLGWVNEPYWEVYPVQGDTRRFMMNDTDKLMKCINRAVKEKQNGSKR